MKSFAFICVLSAAALASACSESGQPANTATNTTANAGGNPLNAPGDYLGALGRGQQKAVSTVDTSSLTRAIEMYNVDHGKNPASLDELVKGKYIAEIPAAPHGMKLVYDPASGNVGVAKE